VLLEKENAAAGGDKRKSKSAVVKEPKSIDGKGKDNAASGDQDGKETSAATRQRRRPRKLNRSAPNEVPPTTTTPSARPPGEQKEPATSKTYTSISAPTTTPKLSTSTTTTTTELEALKSRVRGLEAKVEELYASKSANRGTRARSPRRRGKGRKHSSTSVNTQTEGAQSASKDAETTPRIEELDDEHDDGEDDEQKNQDEQRVEDLDEDDDDDDTELTRLEADLALARRDLHLASSSSSARPRPTKRHPSSTTTPIEEIPRDTPPGVDSSPQTWHTGDRQVTLTGSYRIPLPASVSMEDVKSIQSGVSAAQNVARGILEKRRRAQAQQQFDSDAPTPEKQALPKQGVKSKTRQTPSSAVSTALAKEDPQGESEKQSWSQWFGGYSMAISRAVKNIEAEAAIESQRVERERAASAEQQTGSKKKGAAAAGAGGKTKKRPPGSAVGARKGAARKLSTDEVEALMK
jgi:hypothetical protein